MNKGDLFLLLSITSFLQGARFVFLSMLCAKTFSIGRATQHWQPRSTLINLCKKVGGTNNACAHFFLLLEIVSPNWFKTVVVVHQVMAWARALPVPLCTTVATEANDCPRATWHHSVHHSFATINQASLGAPWSICHLRSIKYLKKQPIESREIPKSTTWSQSRSMRWIWRHPKTFIISFNSNDFVFICSPYYVFIFLVFVLLLFLVGIFQLIYVYFQIVYIVFLLFSFHLFFAFIFCVWFRFYSTSFTNLLFVFYFLLFFFFFPFFIFTCFFHC